MRPTTFTTFIFFVLCPNRGEKLTLFICCAAPSVWSQPWCLVQPVLAAMRRVKTNLTVEPWRSTMDLSLLALNLSLFWVFIPGKSANINKCWIWACMGQRFQSLPESKFALQFILFLQFSWSLSLLAIKCQHLCPCANIITCFRISARPGFGLHSLLLNLLRCCLGEGRKPDFQVSWCGLPSSKCIVPTWPKKRK